MDGPQMDVSGGINVPQSHGAAGGCWQGMSIKDILEKVDLFNFTSLADDDGQKKSDRKEYPTMTPDLKIVKPEPSVSTAKSAFLGPKIWKKPLSFKPGDAVGNNAGGFDGAGSEFSVMNIDEFLTENNFDFSGRFSPSVEDDETEDRDARSSIDTDGYRNPLSCNSMDSLMDAEQPIPSPVPMVIPQTARRNEQGLKRKLNGGIASSPNISCSSSPLPPTVSEQWTPKIKNGLPKGDHDFLYAESKRAKIEREKEERRRREEVRVEFSPEELALATIPGANFDPSRRQFSMDELKPQPIIRKRRKSYVSADSKDDKYWEKRGKNNVAARRSREARRLKENQISLRTAYLEQQNSSLKASLVILNEKNEKLSNDKKILMDKLKKFESMTQFLDESPNVM